MNHRAITVSMVDFGYDPDYAQELASLETSPAILVACEALTSGSLLEPSSEARELWEDDTDHRVADWIQEHCWAEEGDTLYWGDGQLQYRNGRWA